MSNRSLYLLFVGIGGTAGSLLPGLWGAGDLSAWSILLGMIGGFFGLWLAYKLTH